MDLWFLAALALAVGIACMAMGLRLRRGGWLLLLVGLFLLAMFCFVLFLQLVSD